jgi:hypothetical protein
VSPEPVGSWSDKERTDAQPDGSLPSSLSMVRQCVNYDRTTRSIGSEGKCR